MVRVRLIEECILVPAEFSASENSRTTSWADDPPRRTWTGGRNTACSSGFTFGRGDCRGFGRKWVVSGQRNTFAIGTKHRQPGRGRSMSCNQLDRHVGGVVAAQAGIQRARSCRMLLTCLTYTMPERGYHVSRNELRTAASQAQAKSRYTRRNEIPTLGTGTPEGHRTE